MEIEKAAILAEGRMTLVGARNRLLPQQVSSDAAITVNIANNVCGLTSAEFRIQADYVK